MAGTCTHHGHVRTHVSRVDASATSCGSGTPWLTAMTTNASATDTLVTPRVTIGVKNQ